MRWESPWPHAPAAMMFCPSNHGLNILKTWTKINSSSLKLFMSGIWSVTKSQLTQLSVWRSIHRYYSPFQWWTVELLSPLPHIVTKFHTANKELISLVSKEVLQVNKNQIPDCYIGRLTNNLPQRKYKYLPNIKKKKLPVKEIQRKEHTHFLSIKLQIFFFKNESTQNCLR
jgi:hypothetical protein